MSMVWFILTLLGYTLVVVCVAGLLIFLVTLLVEWGATSEVHTILTHLDRSRATRTTRNTQTTEPLVPDPPAAPVNESNPVRQARLVRIHKPK